MREKINLHTLQSKYLNRTNQAVQFKNNRPENMIQLKAQKIANQNTIQLKTSISYGPTKKFTLPDNNKTTIDVASGAYAIINPNLPEQGTDTSGFTGWGNALQILKTKTKNSWVAGHLINHDLGGRGILDNFFPITKAANTEHFWKVENPLKQWLNDNHKFHYIVRTKQYSNTSPSGEFDCQAQVTSTAPGKSKPSNINEVIKSIPKTAAQKAKDKKAAKAAKAAKKKSKAKRADVPKKWKHLSGNQAERKAAKEVRKKASSGKYLYLDKNKWRVKKTHGM